MYVWCGYCKIVKTRLAPVRLSLRLVIFLMRVEGAVKVNRVSGGGWVGGVADSDFPFVMGTRISLKWRDKLSWKERQKQRRRQTNRCTEAEERTGFCAHELWIIVGAWRSALLDMTRLNQSIRQSFLTSVSSSTMRQNIFFRQFSLKVLKYWICKCQY